MQVIGVVDLKGGRAVHARGGRREHYQLLTAIAGVRIDGDPLAAARAYVERLGLDTLYVADLDAIAGVELNIGILARLADIASLWVDAGTSSVARAQRVLDLGARSIVVGLETLSSFDDLSAICNAVSGRRVVMSLDVRDGAPITRMRDASITEIATNAVSAGAGALILLDLARVGTGGGPDFAELARVRAAAPDVPLFAAGGIRGAEDLAQLAALGCAGALVASALHDGALSATR
jgi:phosphoribosylformimino-5-aminoimidazole carboxamide ribotide isomerase